MLFVLVMYLHYLAMLSTLYTMSMLFTLSNCLPYGVQHLYLVPAGQTWHYYKDTTGDATVTLDDATMQLDNATMRKM